MEREKVDTALDLCYEAVFQPESWPDALHGLASSVHSVCAMFYPEEHAGRLLSVPASRDYGDFLDDYTRNRWYENHYRGERGWALLKRGRRVVIEHDLATDEERKRLRHYNDLYLRWGFPGFAMIGFKFQGKNWGVPLLRDKRQGHFAPGEREELGDLAPHFRRMLQLTERLDRERLAVGMDVIECLRGGAILMSGEGRVLAMNAKAEAFLGDGLQVRNGILDAQDPTARPLLYRLVTAGRTAARPSARASDRVVIRRPAARPLVVEAFPIRGLVADAFGLFGSLLIVTDLDESLVPAVEDVARILELTPAEARLVVRLCEGSGVSAAAAELGISAHTARSYAKTIFSKTGTNRQAQLVALAQRIGSLPKRN